MLAVSNRHRFALAMLACLSDCNGFVANPRHGIILAVQDLYPSSVFLDS